MFSYVSIETFKWNAFSGGRYMHQAIMIVDSMSPEYHKAALDKLKKQTETQKQTGINESFPLAVGLGNLTALLLKLTPVYFFTRRRVKEQFEAKES